MQKFIVDGFEIWAEDLDQAKEKYRLWCLPSN
jgi:hypothetical protein